MEARGVTGEAMMDELCHRVKYHIAGSKNSRLSQDL